MTCSQLFAKLSPSKQANLQLSWAEIAILSELRGTYIYVAAAPKKYQNPKRNIMLVEEYTDTFLLPTPTKVD